MAGFVHALISNHIDAVRVEPMPCPYQAYNIDEETAAAELACWESTGLYGERSCRYFAWAAHSGQPTRRLADLQDYGESLALKDVTTRRCLVWCGLAVDRETRPGC